MSYDAAGRPLVQTNANGTVTTRTYLPKSGLLDLLQTTHPRTGTIQDPNYDYEDRLPLVSKVTSSFPGEGWEYAYDDGYRMVEAKNLWDLADIQTFVYDSLGRIRENSRVGIYDYPASGQPQPHTPSFVDGTAYEYYLNGNLKLGGGPRAPEWDAENRVAAIGTARFEYDAFGERFLKTSPQGTSLYPFGDDYEITDGIVTKYFSVEGLGVIAKRITGGPEPGTYWLHTDRLGSIQAMTSDGSDPDKPAGSIVFRKTYRPYGETLSQSGDHTESRGWIDQRNDPESGLTYLHARYFDPKLGIFLSPDPIGVAGGMNLYGYGFGDPVNKADRFGLDPDQPIPVFPTEVGATCSPVPRPGCPGYNGSYPSPNLFQEIWLRIKEAYQRAMAALNPSQSPYGPNGPTGPVGGPGPTPTPTPLPAPTPSPKPKVIVPNNVMGPLESGIHYEAEVRFTRCGAIPPAPPGADLHGNMREAASHLNPFWFYNQVRNKGPWDYKQVSPYFEAFGNFNYGATGASFGFPRGTLLREAGRGQMEAGTSMPGWGYPGSRANPWGGQAPYGDSPIDQAWIQGGIDYAGCQVP